MVLEQNSWRIAGSAEPIGEIPAPTTEPATQEWHNALEADVNGDDNTEQISYRTGKAKISTPVGFGDPSIVTVLIAEELFVNQEASPGGRTLLYLNPHALNAENEILLPMGDPSQPPIGFVVRCMAASDTATTLRRSPDGTPFDPQITQIWNISICVICGLCLIAALDTALAWLYCRRYNMPSDELVIRPAQPAYASGVARLLREVFAETYGGAVPAEVLAGYMAREFADRAIAAAIARPDTIDLVAQAGASVAGVCRLETNAPPIDLASQPAIELTKLYVAAAFRGCGIGERLLADAIRAARERSQHMIWLAVWEQNQRAIAFYRRHRFRDAGRMSIFVDSVEFRDLVMLRGLDDR